MQRTWRSVACRIEGDIERDIERNYAEDVIMLTSRDPVRGIAAVRHFDEVLRRHVPNDYEIPLKLVGGPYAYIEWRAREPGRSVEDGADSFVIRDGMIVFQSIHYSLQETFPDREADEQRESA